MEEARYEEPEHSNCGMKISNKQEKQRPESELKETNGGHFL
jgi:hypothetical protein